jgi:hypothetical protein
MPKGKDPRKAGKQGRKRSRAPNPGLPDKETVISERTLTSPKGTRYRIITTTERDPYDPPDDDGKHS